MLTDLLPWLFRLDRWLTALQGLVHQWAELFGVPA